MKSILILGAGEMQVPVIIKSKEKNVFTIVADYDKKAPGFVYADECIYISTNDFDKLLLIAKQFKVDGILTTSDFPVNVVAKISKELNLSAMSVEVAAICTDKYAQRLIFQNNAIRVPEFKVYSSLEDTFDIRSYPQVLKPVDSSASRGVRKIFSKDDLLEQFSQTIAYSQSGKVLVEAFVKGREFSVETLTQDYKTTIIAITEKLLIGEEIGYFVENTHIQPARITPKEKNQIEIAVIEALNVIKVNNCPTHTEVKLNEEGVFIIEIACRLGGDYITSDLVPLSTGVDMLANLIKISLGERINIQQTTNKCSCVQFLNTNNYEKCKSFIQSKDTHIIRSEIKKFHNKEIKSSLDRMGYIIMQSNTMAEIESILEKIK